MFIKKKLILISLLLLVLLTITSVLHIRSMGSVTEQWNQYQQSALQLQNKLADIQSAEEVPWQKLDGMVADSILAGIDATYILLGVNWLALLIFFLCLFLILNSASKRFADLHRATVETGKGDFSPFRTVRGEDEIAVFSRSLDSTFQNIQTRMGGLLEQAATLGSASESLFKDGFDLAEDSRRASGQTNSTAAAIEEMSTNLDSMALASEAASTSISLVASAIEEILHSVEEESRQTGKAQEITRHAVSLAASSSEKVDALGLAATEIDKVTEVITQISGQTNLLALNATIEAARAGQAGKGFAVVAHEIKELAKQTAGATGEIKEKIASIQYSTHETVDEIRQITAVINEVDAIVSEIALAVQEQSTTSGEISQNIVQVADGIAGINENMAQTSAVSSEIATNITETSSVVSRLAGSGNTIQEAAGNLTEQIAVLQELIGQLQKGK